MGGHTFCTRSGNSDSESLVDSFVYLILVLGYITQRMAANTAQITCIKFFLILFNIIFWLTGFGLLGIGIWAKIGIAEYNELTSQDYTNVPFVIIAVGCFIIITGLIGCCATIRVVSWLLKFYGILLFLVMLAELAAGIAGFVYRGPLQAGFKEGLEDAMNKYFDDPDKKQAIDDLQDKLDCCGSDGYESWNTTSIPLTCCVEILETGDFCVENDDGTTKIPPENADKYFHTDGCFSKVSDFLDENLVVIGATALAIAFFQVFGILLACCMAKVVDSNKYEMV